MTLPGSPMCETAAPALPAATADHSRFVQRVRRRYPDELACLPPGLPRRDEITALVALLQTQGRSLASALRVARHVVLERLAVLDTEQAAPMQDITLVMTELAEATLGLALTQACAEQDALHGVPRNAQGERIDFWIVGMGKLGARELNVSSDIDLIYVYEEDGQTDGGSSGALTAHEYFSRLAHGLYALIGETTDDGQVFRVDLALRPNGNSGPAAVSLAMLEEYLQVQGREWERFAWLKSRVVAPRESVVNGKALALRTIVTAFVYRRYLDYGVFEGLRQLHRKVRDEAQRRAAGRPERANCVKLSRGGIREIEFIVQLLLVVRGGQFPEIRTRCTLKALDKLAAGGLMKPESAQRLGQAYVFLRELEHRIQYLDDQQTHQLPTQDADLAWIAATLWPPEANMCRLLQRFCETREFVATEFDALLHERDNRATDEGGAAKSCRQCTPPALPLDSEQVIERLPPPLAARIQAWSDQGRLKMLREDSKQRLTQLMLRSVQAMDTGQCALGAVLSFTDWLEPLLRRESYIALLVERPAVHQRLLRLLGMARWPMRYLIRYPGVIDELADDRLLHRRFDAAEYRAELEGRHDAWQRAGEADEEALLDTLRRAHHAEVFRTLVRDVEGHVTVEQVADDLSALADATLACALEWSWSSLKSAHRPAPRFAVIAYGKLGGKELGYGSDLDLVFLVDEADEPDTDRAAEVYSAYVRKFIHWLTLRTSAGELFDIDTALRPNGSSGLLVTTVDRYENYQTGRGSNTAWTWEHQALSRARVCVGPPDMADRFDAVRATVLSAPRDHAALRTEIQTMREKVRRAHAVPAGLFDVKHSTGGMMDMEFAVQYLVLAFSGAHPTLLDNVGNIALLQRAEAAGLLAQGVGTAAAAAYRDLRRIQHRARLNEQPTQVDPDSVAHQRQAVMALWQGVFAGAPLP
ncbi:MAG: bifunctional [glutamate--ammonia ligase]-adenylyl-L-tyrosine phosphorylase/[glutamate--ammonia-ligase] adenylyltransferase [Pseudomonadota bacterium]